MTINFDWTEDSIKILREMLLAGCTSRECAAKLGVTRNAVIGKSRRMKLERGIRIADYTPPNVARIGHPDVGAPWTAEDVARLRQLRASGMVVTDIAVALGRTFFSVKGKLRDLGIRSDEPKRAERTPRPFVAQVVDRPDNIVSIMDLRHNSCRFPFGDPGSDDFGYCGERTNYPGSSWCPFHYRLVFVPSNSKRRAI